MITNFKLFEEKECQIWVVPLEIPCFYISLKKIGMSSSEIAGWLRLHKIGVFTDYGKYPDKETITIKKRKNGFTWYGHPSTEGNEYTDFMGRLECTTEEIQNYYDEIEFQKNVKKYNL